MARFVACFALVLSLSIPSGSQAQSPELPVPSLIVKDADGKVMGQVAGFFEDDIGEPWPVVVLDIEGTPAFLIFQPFGLIDRNHLIYPSGTGSVYFDDLDCTGTPYVNFKEGLEQSVGTYFGVAGPDPDTGEYELFRSTSYTMQMPSILSWWRDGECYNETPSIVVLAAEEVVPNPLEGFHGPTTAQPDRVLTLSGGDRIRQVP